MAKKQASRQVFNIVIVGQNNRLQFEALLFAASLRYSSPGFQGRLFVATPQPGKLWPGDPSVRNPDVLRALHELDAEVVPFSSKVFGANYPHGNKIEALSVLPKGEPFVFFDTDTLITGDISTVPFNFDRPSASMRREGTWPEPTLYGPGYTDIWKSLYDRFGLNFESSLDKSQPDEYWEKYLYFNAGYFYYSCPHKFGQRFLEYATDIYRNPPPELICQSLDPWLDQVALPLVIHSFRGGRRTLPPGMLDGTVSCHYRNFPLLYARESDYVIDVLENVAAPNKIKKVLKNYEPMKKMIYQSKGQKVRALFDQDNLPRKEQPIRNRIKSNGWWMR
ncbi:hypothetical protein [Falsiruegeria mediterranea]|jgi:hypothetical protein|uniref:Nucleotide-diphospho-sugar transferase domain-containing protein n=1 Tax=Falsiruegeria mediterranea M17 TaxID=1200281 RepID=A0A2R8CEA2_9RHOB|nr:hypothetical protein [Falsiruegeria mediterranea]SPJ30752.1 hypothetical protein TRM7615_04286 [Falsiruegeria mediterranea M17]